MSKVCHVDVSAVRERLYTYGAQCLVDLFYGQGLKYLVYFGVEECVGSLPYHALEHSALSACNIERAHEISAARNQLLGVKG